MAGENEGGAGGGSVAAAVLQEGVLEGLSPLASRVALEAAAALPRGEPCLCHSLKSEQPPDRHLRV